MENGRSAEFSFQDETVYQLVQNLDSNPVQLEKIATTPLERGGTLIEFLDVRTSLYASRILRSEFMEFSAEFDNYNRHGQSSIRFTEAKLDKADQYLGQTVFIEVKRPRGNHHLLEIYQPVHDDIGMAIKNHRHELLEESPETDELIDGIASWLAHRAEQRRLTGEVTAALFEMCDEFAYWREDHNPPNREYKLFMTARGGTTTSAQRLQKSHYFYLPPAQDTLATPGKPNITKFYWVKESFKDGRVDISVEVLRSTGHNHLLTMSREPGTGPEIALKIFSSEGKQLKPTADLLEFMSNLYQADKSIST